MTRNSNKHTTEWWENANRVWTRWCNKTITLPMAEQLAAALAERGVLDPTTGKPPDVFACMGSCAGVAWRIGGRERTMAGHTRRHEAMLTIAEIMEQITAVTA